MAERNAREPSEGRVALRPVSDARRLIKSYVDHYNDTRLNSAIGYTPRDMLSGHQQEIFAERDRKLEAAREQRKNRHQRAA
jgi:putative transposase